MIAEVIKKFKDFIIETKIFLINFIFLLKSNKITSEERLT